MASRPFRLKYTPLLVFVVLRASLAGAEPPTTNAWQPIIFSSPDNDQISSNLTSLSTQPVPPANLQGGLFENTTPVPSLSFGPAPVPDTGRRFQKKSNDRSDWIFQTPAEIMGVAPDQILPSGKRDQDDQQDKLTPLERYLERQNYGSRSKLNPSRVQNSWDNDTGQTNGDSYSPDQLNTRLSDRQSPATPSQPLNSVPSTVTANNWVANPNPDSVWVNVLGNPAPPQSTPNSINSAQQQADMDQFRQMLNPGFTPVNTPTTVPDSANSFKPQVNSPVSSSTQPLVNPIGASFAPLNSGIGQPAPLAPLPGITSQANTQSPLAPAWAPQPAPWTSPNPQPFTIPQRKF